jgi:hypothetical protein
MASSSDQSKKSADILADAPENFERGFFLSPPHKRKFKKNAAILAIVAGLMVLIWAVTMIKVAVWMPDGSASDVSTIKREL